ncbi:unnamed protein product [Porites lobata]|uniref:Uncharacterized protein n=1 Tax=Porites lobata TaxID=104759 RepID=A0ABN8PT54_9CNID|nr:unnamed protein product [Porites lobata]
MAHGFFFDLLFGCVLEETHGTTYSPEVVREVLKEGRSFNIKIISLGFRFRARSQRSTAACFQPAVVAGPLTSGFEHVTLATRIEASTGKVKYRFRSSERGQAKQSEVALRCEESLTTDACYIDDDDDEDDDDDNDADLCRQR